MNSVIEAQIEFEQQGGLGLPVTEVPLYLESIDIDILWQYRQEQMERQQHLDTIYKMKFMALEVMGKTVPRLNIDPIGY